MEEVLPFLHATSNDPRIKEKDNKPNKRLDRRRNDTDCKYGHRSTNQRQLKDQFPIHRVSGLVHSKNTTKILRSTISDHMTRIDPTIGSLKKCPPTKFQL